MEEASSPIPFSSSVYWMLEKRVFVVENCPSSSSFLPSVPLVLGDGGGRMRWVGQSMGPDGEETKSGWARVKFTLGQPPFYFQSQAAERSRAEESRAG